MEETGFQMRFAEWVGVDWGTTRLRAWAFADNGEVIAEGSHDKGMGKLGREDFEPALLELIGPWLSPVGQTPVIACGMVGARQGWIEAAYAPVPCPPPGIERATRAPVNDTRLDVLILPGLSQSGPADVMRGEETQIAGFLANRPDFEGTVCLPGSHAKWVHVAGQKIAKFTTVMTGEIFAALSQHTVLRHSMGDGHSEADFLKGVGEAMNSPETVAGRFFSLRAEGLLTGLEPVAAASRLSGLLIGLELSATRDYWTGHKVALVGAGALTDLYAAALKLNGTDAAIMSGDGMVRAGLQHAWNAFQKRKSA